MSNRQIAGWSAVAFAVIMLIGTFVAGMPPATSDPVREVAEYYSDNQDMLLFGNILNTLAGVFFLLFVSGLYLRLRPTNQSDGEPWALLGLLGAVFTGVAAIAGQVAASVAILRGDEGPGISNIFHDLSVQGYTLTGFGIAVMVFGFGLAMARAKLGPAWLSWFSEAVAVLGLVGASSAGSSSELWSFFGFAALIAFLVWLVVVGMWLAREAVPAPVPTPTV